MRRGAVPFLAVLGLLIVFPTGAVAQVAEPPLPAASVDAVARDGTADPAPIAATVKLGAPLARTRGERPLFSPPAEPRRPAALVPLYVGFVALQGYDTYSTLAAVSRGAREINPIMMAPVKQPAVFVGVKAGLTAASIYAAERLWRKRSKGAAIAVIAAANGVLAVTAVHNARVLRAQR